MSFDKKTFRWQDINSSLMKTSYTSIDHYNMGRLRGTIDTVEEVFGRAVEAIRICGTSDRFKNAALDNVSRAKRKYYSDHKFVISDSDMKRLDGIYGND